jgi:hypothetical protein
MRDTPVDFLSATPDISPMYLCSGKRNYMLKGSDITFPCPGTCFPSLKEKNILFPEVCRSFEHSSKEYK